MRAKEFLARAVEWTRPRVGELIAAALMVGVAVICHHVAGTTGLRIAAGILLLVGGVGGVVFSLLGTRDDADVPQMLLTSHVVDVLADELGKLVEVADQWRATCERAGITPVPSIEVQPGHGPAIRVVGGEPRLVIGPELADEPMAVRAQHLAHEAGHLVAGHHVRAYDVTTCLRVVPSIGKFASLVAAGVGLITGIVGWVVVAVGLMVLAAAVQLVGAAWSRDREYAADAIGAHVLGAGLDGDMTRALVDRDPHNRETDPFGSHPSWADRHTALVSHAELLGRAIEREARR
ncbi:M48 family metalloprotease [Actinopolymorpha sp. B9G3]|uniref:M48 family metalloprotease n=1 Tax=Actinopolymorpha sp. B9G3 TaxID=3158970 RepID=UPI0032D90147